VTTRVVAVVVNYNGGDEVVAAVRSLSILEEPVRVVVVDNGSTDGSPDVLSRELPDIEVIRSPENLGYAGGNNLGFRRARELGAEFVLVLNDDAELVDPTVVRVLVERMEARPDAGIAGPLVVHDDGTPQPTVARLPSFAEAVRLTLARRLRRRPSLPSAERVVPALNGVCLLIRSETLAATGGFDESFFMYGEEADLAHRAAVAGWRSLFVPAKGVVHHHRAGEVRGSAAARVRSNFVRYCLYHRGRTSAMATAALFWIAAVARGERSELETGLRAVLPTRGRWGLAIAAYEAVAVPVLVAVLVVVLALGSSRIELLRQVGSGGKFLVLGLLALGAVTTVVLAPHLWRRRLQSASPLVAYAGLFVALAAASASWSVAPHESVSFAVALALLFAGSLLAPLAVEPSRDGTHPVIDALLIGLAAVVLLSLLVTAIDPHGSVLVVNPAPRRLRGFLESPNTIAAYAFIVPLAVWRAARLRPVLRGLALLLTAAFVVQVVLSGTRLAVVLLAAVLLLYGVTLLPRPGLAFATAATAMLAATAVVTIVAVLGGADSEALPAALRPATISTLSGRTEAWAAAGRIIGQRPVAGHGVGTEAVVMADYRAAAERRSLACSDRFSTPAQATAGCDDPASRRDRLVDFSGEFVHNSFLGLGIQLGLPVTIGWCLVLALAVALAARRIRSRGDARAASAAAVVGGVVWALYSTYLWNSGNVVAAPFWLLVAIAVSPEPQR
jgi:N-acetylglucosaminyl-diphospho-decaprenol L-rhamnosyltransferase